MAELPTGTVTFLLTDVEGSTALWEEAPEAMRASLTRHDVLFEWAVEANGGVHVRPRGEGDSRFAVFVGAPAAVAAAVAIQRAFTTEPWPTPRPIRVRIGLHTGDAELRDGDYYGSAVNRCARLRGIGHGGQVLLSEATAALARSALPSDVGLLDLGQHRLKDLAGLERVFQVVVPNLTPDFPALTSLNARPHNLPTPATALLGRECEVADLYSLFRNGARLVTLTGPGGIGKTRLGLQVASGLLDALVHGVFLVDLAPITDAALVPSTIAQALDVREVGGLSVLEAVKDHLRSKSLLLLLDNFEQITGAAPLVAELLAACPDLRVLVTSREPLRLRGEREYEVSPLALPEPRSIPTPDTLPRYAAVSLFLERATETRADFVATTENAPAIVEICRRLDGLPLAIELAAARVRVLTPRAMVRVLGQRLPFLTGGARDLPTRQQTLRDTIAWSHNLLGEEERRLFRRLAVFVGGWTLEAVEVVCRVDDPALDVTNGLEALASKSLIRQAESPDGEPRFIMLETIREYALHQLEMSGEATSMMQAHATYFLGLATSARSREFDEKQRAAARRFGAEDGNVRAVLGRIRRETTGDIGLSLVNMLSFWGLQTPLQKGRDWAEAMLAMAGDESSTAWVLYIASGIALVQTDFAAARSFAQESVAIFRAAGDLQGAGRAVARRGVVELIDGNIDRARALFEEGVALAQRVDDFHGQAFALSQLGALAQDTGDLASAYSLRSGAAAIARDIGNGHVLGLSLIGLASIARMRERIEQSTHLFKQALRVSSELHDQLVMLRSLAGLAGVAGLAARPERAARLFGAVEAARESSGVREFSGWRAGNDQDVVAVRLALGEHEFQAAWAEGRSMTLELAITHALE